MHTRTATVDKAKYRARATEFSWRGESSPTCTRVTDKGSVLITKQKRTASAHAQIKMATEKRGAVDQFLNEVRRIEGANYGDGFKKAFGGPTEFSNEVWGVKKTY